MTIAAANSRPKKPPTVQRAIRLRGQRRRLGVAPASGFQWITRCFFAARASYSAIKKGGLWGGVGGNAGFRRKYFAIVHSGDVDPNLTVSVITLLQNCNGLSAQIAPDLTGGRLAKGNAAVTFEPVARFTLTVIFFPTDERAASPPFTPRPRRQSRR